MSIEQVLDALVTYLRARLTTGGDGVMPGVTTVKKGDWIASDGQHPVVTVDWDGESLGGDRSLTIVSEHQIAFRLYVNSTKKDDTDARLARTLYQSEDGLKGLRKALLTVAGLGFSLTVSQATKIRPETRPNLRFSAGIEVLALCKLVGGR